MWYKLIESDNGDYEKEGEPNKRYHLSECDTAYTPQGINIGYYFFESKEECIESWKLRMHTQK